MWVETQDSGWVNLDHVLRVTTEGATGQGVIVWADSRSVDSLLSMADAQAVFDALKRRDNPPSWLVDAAREMRHLETAIRNMPRSLRVGY